MSPSEVAWRVEDYAKRWAWLPEQVGQDGLVRPQVSWLRAQPAFKPGQRRFKAKLPEGALLVVPSAARHAVIVAADEILVGRSAVLGIIRNDMADPDWFYDPRTGRRAPSSKYCFWIDHRSEDATGNVKQVWELSRMQHVTVLAAAFALSRDDRYAQRAALAPTLVVGQKPLFVGCPLDERH